MRVVGCFLEFDTKFVILSRHSHKPDGNIWGLPSGKVEDDESDQEAICGSLKKKPALKLCHLVSGT
jgi:8-oxo-dGTP pyrophosphatase MutT (NUDIX family)